MKIKRLEIIREALNHDNEKTKTEGMAIELLAEVDSLIASMYQMGVEREQKSLLVNKLIKKMEDTLTIFKLARDE